MTRYISAADTAKLIRAQLKKRFPGCKFSVRTSTYSGGASIDIAWVDGPPSALVDAVVKPFEGRGFDGMVDLAYSKYAYLLPDGSAAFAQTEGTADSAGMVPADKVFKPCAEAERVHFGANYVFTNRRHSERLVRGALLAFGRRFGEEALANARLSVSSYDGHASVDFTGTESMFYERQFRDLVARRVRAG